MNVLVTGGGTGGHIYPALAIIRNIKQKNHDAKFIYIGTKNGLESKIVPKEQIPFKTVEISGFKRSLSLDNIKTIIRFFKAVKKAKKYIDQFKPDVVIGTGGYVCGPVVYAAAKKGIRTIIHEQNSVPGLTNKFLSKYVDKIAVSFESSISFFPKEKTILTGNPRAQEVVEIAKSTKGEKKITSFGLENDKKTVLIVGGSRGARPINDAVIATLPEWEKLPFQCLYVTGEVHYENVKKEIDKHENIKNISIIPYIHDMPLILREVDLLVARAGATTLAETTALGLPSILIPSPYVTNNHQEKNARALENEKAAKVILEKELTPTILLNYINELMINESLRNEMKQNAKRVGKQDAGDAFYKVMEQLMMEKR